MYIEALNYSYVGHKTFTYFKLLELSSFFSKVYCDIDIQYNKPLLMENVP